MKLVSFERVPRVISWLITILVPFILMMTAIRLLMTPLFPAVEYRTPDFPEDRYGFTLHERLYWSRYAIDYLVNNAGIEYLGDLKFSDGTPLYNERELSHMLDVKNLVQSALQVWGLGLVFLAATGVWAWFGHWWFDFRQAVSRGGWVTVGLIIAVLVAVAVSFNDLFTGFHLLFFTGDTWIFYYSDTLIRLFPMRFWRDAFIIVGAFSLLGGLALGYFARDKLR